MADQFKTYNANKPQRRMPKLKNLAHSRTGNAANPEPAGPKATGAAKLRNGRAVLGLYILLPDAMPSDRPKRRYKSYARHP
jgi:hypothetical protein